MTRFEDAWHYNWLGLELLDLSYNEFSGNISTSQLNFIKFDQSKFFVNLSHNYIEDIPVDVVLEEEMIEENHVNIDIEGNPIASNCQSVLLERSQSQEYHITPRGFLPSCYANQGSGLTESYIIAMFLSSTLDKDSPC